MSETSNPIPVMEMRGVNVGAMRYPDLGVVENVDWTVAPGEFWVVAGQQQSGKSDLLMMAAGLMPPMAGTYRLFGHDTREFGEAELAGRLRAGFVFQGGQLFSQLTVAENVALALRYHKDLALDALAREVGLLLECLGLTSRADDMPASLAANWRQRVALARALILQPEVLILDNPLSGAGARHLHWWLRFLEQLSRGHERCGGRPMTIIVSTDDLRPWQNERHKFALLHEKKFVPLGGWHEVETATAQIVRELLAAQLETIN